MPHLFCPVVFPLKCTPIARGREEIIYKRNQSIIKYMEKKLILISNCKDCPYCRGIISICQMMKKPIENYLTIPFWCPLEDHRE
jgi:thioredoxin-related protein